jgi:hypothetical protein
VLVYSVHGWRHFLVCNTHIPFRLLRRGKKHEIACTSWSSCLWKFCELVSNIEEQLCIVFMYTGNLYHLHDLATQALVSFKNPPLQVSRNLKVIKKMCTFEVHLCMMSGQLILSGKPFNTFSMARLTILQLRLTLTPLFTATHAFIFLSYHFFPMICDWGIFFILATLDLCLLLIHRDLWNSQKWQILISVNHDFIFFIFWDYFF